MIKMELPNNHVLIVSLYQKVLNNPDMPRGASTRLTLLAPISWSPASVAPHPNLYPGY